MKFLTLTEVAQLIAKLTNQPVMEIHIRDWIDLDKDYGIEDKIDEVFKAAPYLNFHKDDAPKNLIQFFCEDGGLILCDNKEEMNYLYNLTVGDDGPTKSNPYDGPARVYASTYDYDGTPLKENT